MNLKKYLNKKTMFLTLGAGLIVMAPIVAVSCSSSSSKDTIAFIVSTKNNPYFKTMVDAATKEASKKGYDLQVLDSANSDGTQKTNIDTAITKGVKGIIINPNNSATAAAQLATVKVPVIAVDRGVDNYKDIKTTISSNNVKAVEELATWMSATTADGMGIPVKTPTFSLTGTPGASAAVDRENGWENKFGKPALTQVADFDRSEAVTKTATAITSGFTKSAIRVVFAANDEMALGALTAIANDPAWSTTIGKWADEKTKANDLYVVGFDGTKDGIQAVKDGKLLATIKQQPDWMGMTAIDDMDQVLNGKTIDKTIDAPTVVVNKSNVDQYL